MVTDDELTEAISSGDQAAFEAFIHRHHGKIFSFLERMLHDPNKAEDLVQETFIKFIHQVKEKNVPEHSQAWLYKVATNLCRDYWRSAGFRKEKPVYEHIPEQREHSPSVVEIYEHQETRVEVIELLDELPEHQREIVIMRFYQELKLKEIAEILVCPLGTVKSRLFHALRYLKDHYAQREEEKGHDKRIRRS